MVYGNFVELADVTWDLCYLHIVVVPKNEEPNNKNALAHFYNGLTMVIEFPFKQLWWFSEQQQLCIVLVLL